MVPRLNGRTMFALTALAVAALMAIGTGAPARPVGPDTTLRLPVIGPAGRGLAPVGATAVTLN
ncbi:hypothetical protein [Motilibacter deserti]|uniref:Uncharacterized protein n=1 Tax=Motilibacter deserti TaxID=2714956 RepID=A0ABX0GTU3_9ACTN|nr:hypothetical protein [Motilibacter deserti]NHC14322.1 hypothetical protein [Motilibacter deserti]